jgi:hypothetical protein
LDEPDDNHDGNHDDDKGHPDRDLNQTHRIGLHAKPNNSQSARQAINQGYSSSGKPIGSSGGIKVRRQADKERTRFTMPVQFGAAGFRMWNDPPGYSGIWLGVLIRSRLS